MREVSYKLKEIRESKNLTQRDLEKISGITHQQISNIETGVSHPTIPTLLTISDALGVEMEKLYITNKK